MPTTERSKKLAEAVEHRRLELGLSPSDMAELTGLSPQAVLRLRQGERRRYQLRLTYPVTTVLGWSPDSIDRLLDGKNPVVEPEKDEEARRIITAYRDGQRGAIGVPHVLGAKQPTPETNLSEIDDLRTRVADLETLVNRLRAVVAAVVDPALHPPGDGDDSR